MAEILAFLIVLLGVPLVVMLCGHAAKPDPDEVHFHLCPRGACGRIWLHKPRDIAKGDEKKAHCCPVCGASDPWARMTMRETLQERLENKSRAVGLL